MNSRLVDIKKTREEVFQRMLRTPEGRRKYGNFIRCLKASRWLLPRLNHELLLNMYCAARIIDDVVDGDMDLPSVYDSPEEYVLARMKQRAEPVDFLLNTTREIAGKMGKNIEREIGYILRSMLFDARRVGTRRVFDRNELDEHYYDLDVRGTVRGSLIVAGEDPDLDEKLKSISEATRAYYDTRDLPQDFERGLINIPREKLADHLIHDGRLAPDVSHFTPEITEWVVDRARYGLGLLQDHRDSVKSLHLRRRTRAILYLVYAQPAKTFFTKVLTRPYPLRPA